MFLSFVYGAAGSGKSTYVQDTLIKMAHDYPERNYLLIVPDQFTMQTQADMVKRHPKGGIMNIDVLSFGRLAYRIFEETGKPSERILDDTGKSLVLRHIASSIKDSMPYLGGNLNKVGFVHEVKSAISEFKQYGVSSEDLKQMAQSGHSTLFSDKIRDLAVVYEAFDRFKEDKFITSEEQLDILCEHLLRSKVVEDAYIVFDGFTGFTPIQERVLETLMKRAFGVCVTLTLSAPEKLFEEGGEDRLFSLSRRTALRLRAIADKNNIPLGESICLDEEGKNYKNAPELTFLCDNLFRYGAPSYKGQVENVEFFAGSNIYTEVDEIINRLNRLIRHDGYSYRDIAIVTGNMEDYGDVFSRRFQENNIPGFIDQTSKIVLNPFIEFLKSALKSEINDYSYDSIFHLLKSGFTDIERAKIDRFDNYAKSLGIRGKSTYQKTFRKREKGRKDKDRALLEVVGHNELRESLLSLFEPLERPAKTGGEYVRNLYDFLEANNSYDKLIKMADRFEAEGDTVKSMEYSQIYRLVMDLLDTIYELLGDEEMSLEEFYRIFEAGITEISVGTIPQNVDRVVVGDIERTRLNHVKVLFFAGINDGNIPKNNDRGGLLSEADRECFKEAQKELAPTKREEMYRQKLYLYMNVCKPSDKLILSYAGCNRDGKSLKPSYFVNTIRHLFPQITVPVCDNSIVSSELTGKEECYRLYSRLLRKLALGSASEEERILSNALYNVLKTSGDSDICEDMADAAFYEYKAVPLSKDIIKGLYGAVIDSSVSRMDSFSNCAYAYYLQYGMELKEQGEDELDARDLGNVYHACLDGFSYKLEKNGLNWGNFTKEQGEQLIKEAVYEYVEEYEQGILNEDAQRQYTVEKIIKILSRTVDTIKFQTNRSKFKPTMHEVPFNREIKLDDETRLRLKGKIDRVDLYEEDGNVYVKLVDYKSGSRDVDITGIYYGLTNQLGVYMDELLKHEKELHPDKEIHPSAMFYYKLDNPIINFLGEYDEEEVEHSIRKELAFKGILEKSDSNLTRLDEFALSDPCVLPVSLSSKAESTNAKHMFTEEEIRNYLDYSGKMTEKIGKEIIGGNISVSPFYEENNDCCTRCRFKSICRFDEGIEGFSKRTAEGLDLEQARNSIFGGLESGN